MCAITVGGGAQAYSDRGAYGELRSALSPILHGTLAFVGCTAIEPFVVYAPGRMDHAERRAKLACYAHRVIEVLARTPRRVFATYGRRRVRVK